MSRNKRPQPIAHTSETVRIAAERAAAHIAQQPHLLAKPAPAPDKAIDLFTVFGISVTKEVLYSAAISSAPDAHNGLYFVVRTVDQNSATKRWDIYIFYVGDGGWLAFPYWFKQGDVNTPRAMGGVSFSVRSGGMPALMFTSDTVPGALFPPGVLNLDPVARG